MQMSQTNDMAIIYQSLVNHEAVSHFHFDVWRNMPLINSWRLFWIALCSIVTAQLLLIGILCNCLNNDMIGRYLFENMSSHWFQFLDFQSL
jgi:hypothetical protein